MGRKSKLVLHRDTTSAEDDSTPMVLPTAAVSLYLSLMAALTLAATSGGMVSIL